MITKRLDIDKYLLVLLMSVSLPNIYFGAFFAIGIFFLKLYKGFRIPKLLLKDLILAAIILVTGIVSFFINYSHIQNLIWGIFTLSSFIIYPLILKYRYSEDKFIDTIKVYLIIQSFVFFIQGAIEVIQFKSINVFFVELGAGDVFKGTCNNSHQFSINIAIISFFFLNKYIISKKVNDLYWYLFTIVLFIIPSYVSGIFIYVITIILVFLIFFFKNLFVNLKVNKGHLKIMIVLCLFIIIFLITQIGNFYYGLNFVSKSFSQNPPRKIISLLVTINGLSHEKWYIPFIGVGIGNYSSRAALIVSGEYLSKQPSWIPPTASKYTYKYITPLWNHQLSLKKNVDGVANQPFFQYQSIYGEMGLIGLIIFLIMITKICFLNGKFKINYLNWFLYIFTLGIFFLDVWAEYPNFALFFWLFSTCNVFRY